MCVRGGVEEREILFIIHLFFFFNTQLGNAREIEDIKKIQPVGGLTQRKAAGGLGKRVLLGCLSCDRTLFTWRITRSQ